MAKSNSNQPSRSTAVKDAAGARPVQVRAARAPVIDSYAAATRYLMDRMDVERTRPTSVNQEVFKLERMERILEPLGSPHLALRCVHIAGTKGKGSTCEMLSSSLEACGYCVGLYTSPHLVDLRERIRVTGRMIPQQDFTRLMQRIADVLESLDLGEVEATFFEIMTAMAMLYFFEQAVDIAVVEVGLGGRLDSTNVIRPDVTAITTIALDHTQLLGDTLAKIANEKAGIIKAGVPVVTYEQSPEVMDVIRGRAEQVGAPLHVIGKDSEFHYRFEADAQRGPHYRVSLISQRSAYEHLMTPLMGEHQAVNCGLVLAMLDKLAERGFTLPETTVATGLERTRAIGRLEPVCERPRIFIDGAHNPESIRCLMKSISAHLRHDSLIVVFGCAADKDWRSMLRRLELGADRVIFTRASGTQRSAQPKDLLEFYCESEDARMAQAVETVEEAIDIARRAAQREDLILVTGSFYLAGEAKRLLAPKNA